MNSYITLDSKRYVTIHPVWQPGLQRPMSVRTLLSGNVDVVYGTDFPAAWMGKISVPVSATSPWGTISDFRTTAAKKQTLSFTDHYGTSYTVVMIGNTMEQSFSPMWDAASNRFMIPIQLTEV